MTQMFASHGPSWDHWMSLLPHASSADGLLGARQVALAVDVLASTRESQQRGKKKAAQFFRSTVEE